MKYAVQLGRRRWYRPSYDGARTDEDGGEADEAAARRRELRIFVEVTARVLEISPDVALGLIQTLPLQGVLDFVHSRQRLSSLFSSMGTFGVVMVNCHAEVMLRRALLASRGTAPLDGSAASPDAGSIDRRQERPRAPLAEIPPSDSTSRPNPNREPTET